EDIRDHIERETGENIARGMTPDAARAAARRAFGSVALAKEDTRAVWIPIWIDQLLQDARYGLRILRRTPAFSAVVILTLAIGIGLSTAVFSVVNAVLVRPLSYPDADRLLWIATYDDRAAIEMVVSPEFVAWRDRAASFEHLAAFFIAAERIDAGDEVLQARIAAVTDGFWDLAGARFALGGRPRPGAEGVVLSHACFERWFHGDAAVVGRPVMVEGRQTIVAGVLRPGFRVQLPPPPAFSGIGPGEIDFYRAIVIRPPTPDGRIQLFSVVGRLKPGVTIARARSELEAIRAGWAQANPGLPAPPRLLVAPYADKLVGATRKPLLILLAAVVLVLVIACANIANLLLARGSARVLRQFLVESLLLAVAGGAAGLLLARAAIAVMLRLIPHAVPRLAATTIDGRVLAFAASAAIATAIVFGFAPTIALWKASVHDLLKAGAPTSTATGGLRVR